jgi:hypothetical protein
MPRFCERSMLSPACRIARSCGTTRSAFSVYFTECDCAIDFGHYLRLGWKPSHRAAKDRSIQKRDHLQISSMLIAKAVVPTSLTHFMLANRLCQRYHLPEAQHFQVCKETRHPLPKTAIMTMTRAVLKRLKRSYPRKPLGRGKAFPCLLILRWRFYISKWWAHQYHIYPTMHQTCLPCV